MSSEKTAFDSFDSNKGSYVKCIKKFVSHICVLTNLTKKKQSFFISRCKSMHLKFNSQTF